MDKDFVTEVGGYFNQIYVTHGAKAFMQGGGREHHTAMAAQLMKEVFAKHEVNPERLNLSSERFENNARSFIDRLSTGLTQLEKLRDQERQAMQQREHPIHEQERTAIGANRLTPEVPERETENRQRNRQVEAQQRAQPVAAHTERDYINQVVSNEFERQAMTLPSPSPNRNQNGQKQLRVDDSRLDPITETRAEREYVLTR